MNNQSIGFIGLGNMGIPLSQRLLAAGYPLTVYNRNKDKTTPLHSAGAATADTPAELIHKTQIIFLMVSDDQAIRDCFTGDTGLLSAKASGKLIINMSTVSPAISREFAAAAWQSYGQAQARFGEEDLIAIKKQLEG